MPEAGEYGMGLVFLPVEHTARLQAEGIMERITREEGLEVLGLDEVHEGVARGLGNDTRRVRAVKRL